jgi:hypothetical protein
MGGLYNMIHGYNPSCLWIMPMLGRKENEWPRFRDCYVEKKDDDYLIVIYTRVGGNNRNSGFGEEELYKDPLFVETIDDDFDNTYAEYKFRVPEKWRADFNKIIDGDILGTSDEYKNMIREFFPLLNEAGKIDEFFNAAKKESEE